MVSIIKIIVKVSLINLTTNFKTNAFFKSSIFYGHLELHSLTMGRITFTVYDISWWGYKPLLHQSITEYQNTSSSFMSLSITSSIGKQKFEVLEAPAKINHMMVKDSFQINHQVYLSRYLRYD